MNATTRSTHGTRTARRAARPLAALGAALVVAGGVALAPAASASGGHDTEVRASGTCSSGAAWKLKAKDEDRRVEVELEVDSNRVGQSWRVTLSDNGTTVFSGTRVTTAPSGSFDVERVIANRAGQDVIRAVATNVSTGETCRGSVTYAG